jgi:mono/diheme cytochrome c family protein
MPRLLAVGLMLAGSAVLAQSPVDLGKREYRSNCANCHAESGKGGGPYVEFLKHSPPDLTMMSKNNGGVFPVSRAYAVIEGAGASHGSRDMPIWGQQYRTKAAEYYADVPYNDETFVRTRILALIEYMSRLQAK